MSVGAAIERELSDLAEGKVMPDVEDLARHEGELLDEQESLEFELGEDYFKSTSPNWQGFL